ncbi:MAG TPA: DUF488 family protein [Vineibacter sp.]|nr:DUF488 family protein [Vineibacter sp.]
MAARSKSTAHLPRVKRVYEPPSDDDGLRILVDRLWPRGIAKDKARIDLWLKDIAPSHVLRKRLHADPTTWDTFIADYARELAQPAAAAAVATLRTHLAKGAVTLLYGARNEERNNATALKAWLEHASRD